MALTEDSREAIRQELEWRRCAEDPVYFLDTYGYMWEKEGGDPIRWRLWDCQKKTLEAWNAFRSGEQPDPNVQRNFIVLKTRQLGLSWLAVGYAEWCMLFIPNFKVYYQSYNKEQVQEQLNRFRFIYENLPSWMQKRCPAGGYTLNKNLKNNTETIEFENNSSIKAIASARSSGHGVAPSLFIADEFARNEKAQYAWRAVLPAINGGGQVLVISTANGIGNKFHELWVDAYNEKSNFKAIFLPASEHPKYTKEFLEEARKDFVGDDVGYYEAYPMTPEQAFTTTSRCPFDGERINWMLRYITENDIKPKKGFLKYHNDGSVYFEESHAGDVEIWKEPQLGLGHDFKHYYTIGADVAQGLDPKKGDYSVAVVLDVTTNEIVAMYRKRVKQEFYAEELKKLGNYYGQAWLAVEANAYADIILNDLKMNYMNIYRREVRDNMWDKPTMKPGFYTSESTRNRIILQYRRAFSEEVKPLRIYSKTILGEMTTFEQQDNGKLEASGKNHDDCVMAVAIAIEAINSMPFNRFEDYEPKHKHLSSKSF